MDNNFYNILGLARKAGKIGWGHDAALQAIKRNSAHLCIMTCDASKRLKNEFSRACTFDGRNVEMLELEITMDEMRNFIGVKAGVITINDEGFAKCLKKYN